MEIKKAILVVSFGTSYNESREKTIGSIEAAIGQAFEKHEVRRAFTSNMIIDKLMARDGLKIDTVSEALERLIKDGYTSLIIQPTYIMFGIEYDLMMEQVAVYEKYFQKVSYGKPLLASREDYIEVIRVLALETEEFNQPGTELIFMGHGTDHQANGVYLELENQLWELGYQNYKIGTVEAVPSLEDVVAKMGGSGAENVVLLPFMIVAGEHANQDMAGDDEQSWKSVLQGAGYEVRCVIKGLGEYQGIRELFVKHVFHAGV